MNKVGTKQTQFTCKLVKYTCEREKKKITTNRSMDAPTNISMKSEPDMEKNGTLDSPAVALANMVLPVPEELANTQSKKKKKDNNGKDRCNIETEKYLKITGLAMVKAKQIHTRSIKANRAMVVRWLLPGGPTRRAPLGILAPSRVNLLGSFKNCTNSMTSTLASSKPATSAKRVFSCVNK